MEAEKNSACVLPSDIVRCRNYTRKYCIGQADFTTSTLLNVFSVRFGPLARGFFRGDTQSDRQRCGMESTMISHSNLDFLEKIVTLASRLEGHSAIYGLGWKKCWLHISKFTHRATQETKYCSFSSIRRELEIVLFLFRPLGFELPQV